MTTVFELAVAMLAVIGVYALFWRFAVSFTPKEALVVAVKGEKETVENIRSIAENMRFHVAMSEDADACPVVLLERADLEKEEALRKEGFLVYIRK